MHSDNRNGFIQQFFLGLPLRKTLLTSTGVAILLLLGVSILGVRQYLLYQHCEQMVTTSQHLLFQFSTIKEHINETLLTREQFGFKNLRAEIEELNVVVARIRDDILIPEEFKYGLVSQTDLIGLVVKLRTVQEAADSPSVEQLSALTTSLRSLHGRIDQFHRGLSSYTQALLLGLHKTVVGSLALVIFVVTSLLLLINRSISAPILQLGEQVRSMRESDSDLFTGQDKKPDVSVHEIITTVTSLSAEHQRLSNIFNAITLYETLERKTCTPTERWQALCSVLQTNGDYCLVWAGTLPQEEELPQPVTACGCLAATEAGCLDILDHLLKYCKKEGGLCDSVSRAIQTRTAVVSRLHTSTLPESLRGLLPFTDDTFSSASFPLQSSHNKTMGIITLYDHGHDCFQTSEITLLSHFFNHPTIHLGEGSTPPADSTPADKASIPTLSRMYRYCALGNLTTDLAHELTSLSNGVTNYTQALIDLTEDQQQAMDGPVPFAPVMDTGRSQNRESKDLLQKLLTEEKKISRLAVDLLQLSHYSGEENRQYTVEDLLGSLERLVKGPAKAEGIELQMAIAPGLPLITKNGKEIQLIILSLIQDTRARVAAKNRAGRHERKKIQITASPAQPASQGLIRITVQDNGTPWPSPERPNAALEMSGTQPWLDLHQCSFMLEHIGGDLSVQADSSGKNSCTIHLPC